MYDTYVQLAGLYWTALLGSEYTSLSDEGSILVKMRNLQPVGDCGLRDTEHGFAGPINPRSWAGVTSVPQIFETNEAISSSKHGPYRCNTELRPKLIRLLNDLYVRHLDLQRSLVANSIN